MDVRVKEQGNNLALLDPEEGALKEFVVKLMNALVCTSVLGANKLRFEAQQDKF